MAADSLPSGRKEHSGPRYTTLGVNMAGLRCVVVGGGRVGSRKAATLAASGAEVTVVAPTISGGLPELVAAGRVRWQPSEYDTAMLAGFVLVVAATPDQALNLRVAADAESRGILCCNVCRRPARGSFFPPCAPTRRSWWRCILTAESAACRSRCATKSRPGCESEGQNNPNDPLLSPLSPRLSLQIHLPDRGQRPQREFGLTAVVEEPTVGEIVGFAVAELVPQHSLHHRLGQRKRHEAGDPRLLGQSGPTARRQRRLVLGERVLVIRAGYTER